ncbi:MAG: thioredoxin family protein [Sphingomonadales bacterium]|jgi:thiol-disulfide isomerase/thioredoxin
MKRIKKLISGSTLLLITAAVLFGRLAYMNLRSDDPLPFGFQQYNAEAFAETQASGALIMVDVYASWCPTCLAQHKVLESLLKEPDLKEIKGFRINFDDDAHFLRAHGVNAQSTIIMFDGTQELSRSIGLTSKDAIQSQVRSALQQVKEPLS